MVNYQTKAEHAAHALRDAIANGEIRPGERIRAEEFAEKLGLSATPVREAIRQLEAEGILESNPHRGAYVTRVSRRDFVEVYRMRGALESLAVHMVIERLTPDDRAELADKLDKVQATFRRESERGNELKARQANKDFHFGLYSAVAGTRLLASIMNLWAVFPFDTLMLVPGRTKLAADEHDEILQAIRDGKPKAAAEAMRRHIEGAAQLLLDSAAASDYFTDS